MVVSKFCWFATSEDFEDGLLNLDISAGRLRHRWVPLNESSARLYLKNSIEAEGLRNAADRYTIVEIFLSEPIEDLSSDYPNAIVPDLNGAVIRIPFKDTIPKAPSIGAIKRGVIPPPISYTAKVVPVETKRTKQVAALEMGILSAEEIEQLSVVEVISAGSFQQNNSNDPETPVENGVHDRRMGITDTDDGNCPTCNLGFKAELSHTSCPGHFGHIVLFTPIPKLMYLGIRKSFALATDPLLNALNKVCFSCSKILLPQGVLDSYQQQVESVFKLGKRNPKGYEEIRKIMEAPFNRYHKQMKQPCPYCNEFSPEVRFLHTQAMFFFPNPDERYFSGTTQLDFRGAHNVLRNIADEDCKFLGLDYRTSRPENMFYVNLPVAPNAIRPPKSIPNKKFKDLDDLTKLYQDVINANEILREFSVTGRGNTEYWRKQLYLSVSRIYDNQKYAIGSGGTSQERGYGGSVKSVSFRGIMNRLSGKRGRFRNNIQSKYVEQVSYSTITPHAALSVDEVGVPIKIAMGCSVSERVTPDNMERLKEMVYRGPNEYPGATHIYADGDTLNAHPTNFKRAGPVNVSFVKVGAVVSRHVINGDIGLFNRAPSLHRQSVLAMRAKVMKANSLSMNPTICIPFNADYDGDAMKLHFVQSEEAIAEARKWMQLDKNIIHARYGKLTVATDQDQTSGLYLLSHTDKNRRGEWNPTTGLGFTLEEGIPYISHSLAISCYTYVYSEIRDESELTNLYKAEKRVSKDKMPPFEEWRQTTRYRTVDSLPESDYTAPDGSKCYTGRAIFSHLFKVLNCEYVSAAFEGNTPEVDEFGKIKRKSDKVGKEKELIVVYNGKLIQGTLEKDSFGEGGSSLAPSFIYHEGYEKGQQKLVEYIEMVTRLGYAGHRVIGYTMGLTDVSVYSQENKEQLNRLYNQYSIEIQKMNEAWQNNTYERLAKSQQEKIDSIVSPADFVEEKIVNAATEYENKILVPIEDEQGSGNAMQIAVRSKARGKDENVRQMGGSFGIALVGGKRITHGINKFRPLPHFPIITNDGDKLPLTHPIHSGFVKSGYAKGMEPYEYWFTSSSGRRSAVESGQGNISKSGYLERKMIKSFESIVVNEKRQVVNTRTGRVINPLVGDDGLAPYHIRGSHEYTNKRGHIITLQPLLFDFQCKHGKPLEDSHTDKYPQHQCLECSKGSKLEYFLSECSGDGFEVSPLVRYKIIEKLQTREMYAQDLRNLGKKLYNFYNDSICRQGEAIGATAGGCLGEPATQAALRSFHFAGKLSFQGSVNRLEQMLESPLTANANIFNPQTKIPMNEEYNTEKFAQQLATICRSISAEKIIKLIEYDLNSLLLMINFDEYKVKALNLTNISGVVIEQIKSALVKTSANIGPFEIVSDSIQWDKPLIIRLPMSSPDMFMRAKESILSTKVSGITNATSVSIISPDDGKSIDNKFTIDIRDASNETLTSIVNHLSDYLDVSSLETNNLGWIYRNFGLEAMLWMFFNELNFQMNGPGGIGEYDVRYIRMIADLMGEEGMPTGLGPDGIGSKSNYSILSAASVEGVPSAIMAGSVMGNYDALMGPAEAIVAGKTVPIGDKIPKQ